MTIEVKNCPFCGYIPMLLIKKHGMFLYFHIYCGYKDCVAKPTISWESYNDYSLHNFINLWNTTWDKK